jgi:predicted deacylase
MMIESTTFHSGKDGAHLVVFGAVHGNEVCGTTAIRRCIAAMEAGELTLERGKITLVPICNPRAYAAGVRFVERNLNRHFYPKATHTTYEDTLDPILCGILDDADALLDMHSYQSEGEAFCFLGTTSQREVDFARALGVPTYIYGWADAFSQGATEEQRLAGLGTTDYARSKVKPALAVTLECGNHHDRLAAERGYLGILRALNYFHMMHTITPQFDAMAQRCVRMEAVFYKEKAGMLARPWRHAAVVVAGAVLAVYADGSTITAPSDGVIVLPKTETDHALGAEWFYFGVEVPFPVIGG